MSDALVYAYWKRAIVVRQELVENEYLLESPSHLVRQDFQTSNKHGFGNLYSTGLLPTGDDEKIGSQT